MLLLSKLPHVVTVIIAPILKLSYGTAAACDCF
jgi:hypothetical protein